MREIPYPQCLYIAYQYYYFIIYNVSVIKPWPASTQQVVSGCPYYCEAAD